MASKENEVRKSKINQRLYWWVVQLVLIEIKIKIIGEICFWIQTQYGSKIKMIIPIKKLDVCEVSTELKLINQIARFNRLGNNFFNTYRTDDNFKSKA
ncbi:Calcium-dependent lipid-binding family protein isoform 1 [Gossypium australe]|uniref:Calcium-dependent lipid-binding family protein isoform 1 n=1 Tax=Gossypium australe TaxID=47621 RepID=A0A5B6WK65_9ROSI|nr:Calcium-dependent lipid-binding family protein isoform 1 [Gossypium australe]